MPRIDEPPELAEGLWTTMLSSGSVYDEKFLKALFVEGVTHPICNTLRRWCVEHQYASLEDLAQREESLLNLEGRPQQKETTKAEQPKYEKEHRNVKTCKRQVMNIVKEIDIAIVTYVAFIGRKWMQYTPLSLCALDHVNCFEIAYH